MITTPQWRGMCSCYVDPLTGETILCLVCMDRMEEESQLQLELDQLEAEEYFPEDPGDSELVDTFSEDDTYWRDHL